MIVGCKMVSIRQLLHKRLNSMIVARKTVSIRQFLHKTLISYPKPKIKKHSFIDQSIYVLPIKYRIGALIYPNPILGAHVTLIPNRIDSLRAPIRYQVSNCQTYVYHLDTWYRIDTHMYTNSIIWYRIGIHMSNNSIPSIKLGSYVSQY